MSERVYTKNAPDAIGPYSQAVRSHGMIYTSGQIPIEPKSGKINATDIVGQTRQVCENIKAILDSAGSDITRVVKTTCFLSDMSYFNDFNNVYATYFTSKPARSCVAVKELPRGVLVEIEAVAETD